MSSKQNVLFRDWASYSGIRESTVAEQPHGAVWLAWTVRFAAFLNLVAAMFYHEPNVLYWLSSWVPFEISEGRRLTMLLTCGFLLFLASGLERRKRTAWWLTNLGLGLSPLLHYGREVIWPHLILNYAIIALLIAFRRQFIARSDQKSIHTALLICPAVIVSVVLFGAFRLHALSLQTSGDRSWPGCLQTAVELVLAQNTDTQKALTDQATNLFSSLRQAGICGLALGLLLVLRPVLLRQRPSAEQIHKVREIIAKHGTDSLDSYALLSDKSYFFASNGDSVVPYALSGNCAVALVGPIGPRDLRRKTILEFSRYCSEQDWQPIFHQVSACSRSDYGEMGYLVFKVVEEATLEADKFCLGGGLMQNIRTSCNRAKKEGLGFLWYDENSPRNLDLEQACAVILQWCQ
jgi:lysylphosphatidylglycerol synthetase-like protein (DUF2156 family)